MSFQDFLEDYWGAGLRPQHYDDWSKKKLGCFLEILTDNYLFHQGGPALDHLESLKEIYPLLAHGVGLNIGSVEPFDDAYLKRLKGFLQRFQPKIISDHCCFIGVGQRYAFDLLPLPRNQSSLAIMKKKLDYLQDYLDRRFSIENVSRYISYESDEMGEIEFLVEVSRSTGCGILLDVNNLYVSSRNEGFSWQDELKQLEPSMVTQYHIAGHQDFTDYLFDSHDQIIKTDVWQVLKEAWRAVGSHPVILERDDDAPWSELAENWRPYVQLG
ncbi:DUF692 domain-containing protein [Pseudobacteriovorax antillogorgiicola]|uniref:DUF692 domain-containing protein n=1 Tax=Pseudobacteriovorax antillogorgiicola TaxID=1513793 RepID=A0A1Y6C612_9BACT|nr:DUF692 domain-containing protein [Pseudobacteriovorax antillogorgiicola]TCS49365.1 hypothetical protein EDD56_11545 [Pseudobacteriovorax antillogorgiicola]SMF47489.1 hypothetical protein SAMN06296036_114139 [Pseudobacteriovorax antillogorgiicola]